MLDLKGICVSVHMVNGVWGVPENPFGLNKHNINYLLKKKKKEGYVTLPNCPLLQPHPTPSKNPNSFSFHVSVPALPNPKPIFYFKLEKTKRPAWVIRCFCFCFCSCFSFFVRMKRVKMVISQMGLSLKKK